MKHLTKRSLAWLTSLLMLISIFSSIIVLPTQAATVDYVTSGNYVYNWGQRETVATFMSPMAEAWYDKNNTSYEELAALKGSSTPNSVPSSALYKELKSLMSSKSNHTHITDYAETKNLYRYTDCENSGGKISSFYSGKAIGPGWDGSWNREHTWPNSKGLNGDDENDIMMLRPTSTSENSSRGNKAYGESSGYYHPNSESGGKHDLRGDVARIMLYVYCRWGNTSRMWDTNGVMESREVLLKWVTEDPVDTWELGRNDSVQSITGTRNVFVDYPELIFVMFGAEIPADYQSPSGKASAGAYKITASANNTAYGSVTVSGKNVTATPKAGYAVSGYTILSGSASVVRNGNVFVVTADSDVSIRINFSPREQSQVQFAEGDAVVDSQKVYTGDSITLPAYSGTLPEGVSFVGWVESTVEDATVVPTFYAAGSAYTVAKSVTLYALLSRTEKDGNAQSNVFEPYSGELTPGDYLVVYDGMAMTGVVDSKTRLSATEISANNGNIIVSADNLVWRLAQDGSNWTMLNLGNGTYAAGTGNKNNNQATLVATLTNYAKWTVSVKATGYEFTNVGNVANGANPMLRYNKTVNAFACYATNTTAGGPNKLYKRVGGTTYYFTGDAPAPCEHEYETEVLRESTCGEKGMAIHTCTLCGYSYTEDLPYSDVHVFDDAMDVDCNICGEEREIPTHTPGDLNGDNSVDNKDLGLLQKYLNGWDVVVVEVALDLNGDGSVDNKDLGRLQKYLNGWDVEIF